MVFSTRAFRAVVKLDTAGAAQVRLIGPPASKKIARGEKFFQAEVGAMTTRQRRAIERDSYARSSQPDGKTPLIPRKNRHRMDSTIYKDINNSLEIEFISIIVIEFHKRDEGLFARNREKS
jgi:hypothetical protein